MKYLLGADIGTTSLKAAVFDQQGNMLAKVSKDYTLLVQGDRVEFEAEEYWNMFKCAYDELSAEYPISAISVDTQCETLIVTDENGTPLTKAIVWLDNRASCEAEEIKAHFGNKKVYDVCGQPEITATWPSAKLLWLKKNENEVFNKIKKIFLLEDYILFRLTGKFVTEKTLQSSTIYFDIKKQTWWDEMLDFIGISKDQLPEIKDSAVKVGEFNGAAVVTGAMDQIAGAIGAGVFKKGTVSEMTGTTMAIFAPCESIPEFDPKSIVPCHINYDGNYCRLAWTSTAGIALKWFKNSFCKELSFAELDKIAEKVQPGSNGLTFMPYLCGSVMPKYRPDARGAFLGLTMEHTRAHCVRAILESVACMLKENLDYLGVNDAEIHSVGGGATSPLWLQIKADLTGNNISVLENNETACLGSALLAGVGIGLFESVEEACKKIVKVKRTYTPSGADYSACYNSFKENQNKVL